MSDDSGLRSSNAGIVGDALEATARRYVAGEPCGDGLSAGRDVILGRAVLLQRSEGNQAVELRKRANFFGQLDHAGIGPLIDVAPDDAGATLVLRDVGGTTLAEAVRSAASANRMPALGSLPATLIVFIKLCDILAAAHQRSVVHRAVRLEHIRLGTHGQVVLTGWDAAMLAQNAPATKRFVTSSSATGEVLALDGRHDDIRALGLCLFTALTNEVAPCTAGGALGDLDVATRTRLPGQLVAVLGKAIASDASAGYATVDAFAADLDAVLAGTMHMARPPGPVRLAWEWAARHGVGLGIASVLAIAAGLLANAMAEERNKELRVWGPPLIDEHFQDASWTSHWEPRLTQTWKVAEGRAHSLGEYDSALIFKRRLTPPFAIEYTAQVAKGAKIGDISLWWSEEPGFLADQRIQPYTSRGWLFQLGAWENSYACISRMPANKPVAMFPHTLVAERDYRVRLEVEERTYRVLIDGRLAMSYTGLLPAGSGYISLFSYFPGKTFDDVRISQRELPTLVSPLAIGDGAYQDARFTDAAAHYARVAEVAQDSRLVQQARFRQGLAERRSGDPARSTATWLPLTDPEVREVADCLVLEDLISGPRQALAIERFRWYWEHRPAVREILRTQWVDLSARVMARADLALDERLRWFDLREELFPDEPVTALSAAQMLLAAGRHELVIQRFPLDHRACADALLALGRNQELLAQPWVNSRERGQALYNLGRLQDIANDSTLYPEMQALALVKLGRIDVAMAQPWGRAYALVHSGQAAEVLAMESVPVTLQNPVLIMTGRLADAAGSGIAALPSSGGSATAGLLLGGLTGAVGSNDGCAAAMAAMAAGETDKAKTIRQGIAKPPVAGWRDFALIQHLVLPLLDQELGQHEALRSALVTAAAEPSPAWGGLLQQIASAALDPANEAGLQGTVWQSEAKAWILVARALRGELAADRAAARAAWSAFLALPMHERLLAQNEASAVLELCAAWRIAAGNQP